MYALTGGEGGQPFSSIGGATGGGGRGTGGVRGIGGMPPIGSGGIGAGGVIIGAGGKGAGGAGGAGGMIVGTGGVITGAGGAGAGGMIVGTGGVVTGSGGAGTGGMIMGTGGVMMGTGGAGTGGGAVGLDCTMALQPAGGLVTSFADWNATTGRWGPSDGLHGVKFAFGGGPGDAGAITQTANIDPGTQYLHLTLMAAIGGYAGGGISFDSCVTAAAYTAVQFTIAGSTDGCAYQVQLQTFEQRPNTYVPPGGCATNCNRFPPATGLAAPNGTTTPMTVTVPFSSFSGWTASMATELVGVQWQVNSPSPSKACNIDVRIDDIKFVP